MPHCPKCAAELTEQEARSIWASYRSGRRKTIGRQGGRPRTAPRCPCGRYTVAVATKRGHRCGPAAEEN